MHGLYCGLESSSRSSLEKARFDWEDRELAFLRWTGERARFYLMSAIEGHVRQWVAPARMPGPPSRYSKQSCESSVSFCEGNLHVTSWHHTSHASHLQASSIHNINEMSIRTCAF